MTKIKTNKSALKEKGSYYYEEIPIYDALPEEISVPEYTTEIFTEWISHRDILKKYNIKPYTLDEAAAVMCDVIPTLKKNTKSRIVYFEKDSILYRFRAWRNGDGRLRVSVDEVILDNEFGAEGGVCFSNGNLDTLGDSPSDALKLKVSDPYLEMVEWLYLNTGNQLTNEMKGKFLEKLKEILK